MPRFSSVRLAVVPVSVIAWLTLGATGTPAFADANPAAPGQLMKQSAAPVDSGVTPDPSSAAAGGMVVTGTVSTPSASPADTSTGTAGTFGSPSQAQPLSGADMNPGGANNGGDCGAYCSTRNGAPSLNGNGSITDSGIGSTSGKPCAGCVGRADNKNPPGQRPNGSDPNQGYECDGNNGIGQGNPAHTSCQQPAVSPPSTCSSSASGCPQSDCSSSASGCPQSDCSSSASGCPGGQCTAAATCGGSPCATSMSAGASCSPSTPASPPACVPTQANAFCTTVEGEHISRTVTTKTTPMTPTTPTTPTTRTSVAHQRAPSPVTLTPAPKVTTVLGEKLAQTPPPAAALPFTGSPVDAMLATSVLALASGGLLVCAGRRKTREEPVG